MPKETIENYIIEAELKKTDSVFKQSKERESKVSELANILLSTWDKWDLNKELINIRDDDLTDKKTSTFCQQVLFKINDKKCSVVNYSQLDKSQNNLNNLNN